MTNIDPLADTVPCPDAPCDVGDCKEPWKHAVPQVNEGVEETRYVCEAHKAEHDRNEKERN